MGFASPIDTTESRIIKKKNARMFRLLLKRLTDLFLKILMVFDPCQPARLVTNSAPILSREGHVLTEFDTLAWFGLGGNVGDVPATLQRARDQIRLLGSGPLLASKVYVSEPWGLTDQPNFLNQVVGIRPERPLQETLQAVQAFESEEGRCRDVRWGPRTIDIDILFRPNTQIDTPSLQVPHPRLTDRRFVLAPWAELAPDLIIPGIEKSVEELLSVCSDTAWLNVQSPS